MILINRLPFFKRKDPDQARFDRLAKRLESPIEKRFWAHGYGPLSALGRLTPQVKVEGYRVDFALTDVPGVPLLNVVMQVVRFTGSQINRDCAGCVRETVALVKEWRKWLS
jgi:very-short-patch-repair endonuclease